MESPRFPPQHQAEDVQGDHLSTLLCGAEIWTVFKKQARRLSHFHLSCLRRIVRLRWPDWIPGPEVLEWTGILSVYAMLRQLQLRWIDHFVWMDNEGRQGGQFRRYKCTLKTSLKRLQISPATCEDLARDRPTWRRTVKIGGVIYEENRIDAAKVKREARKSQLRPPRKFNAQPPSTCPQC
nr:unnamed protein product [Spirometra erinaceieuropaei]